VESTRRGISRRSFLATAAAATGVAGAALAWKGCSSDSAGGRFVIPSEPLGLSKSGTLLDTDFPDPFAGGQFVGYLPFQGELQDLPTGVNSGGGHNARRLIDLASLLTPGQRTTPAERFFIRTEYPDLLVPPQEWIINIHGEVKQQQKLPLSKLESLVEPQGPVLLECSGNARSSLQLGLLSVGDWDGIPFEKIIALAHPTSKAKAVLFSGFDDDTSPISHSPPYMSHSWPTCSWIFTFEQLSRAKAFLATRLDGAPLPKDNGAPVRLVVPGWFGCTEAKWLNEIKFVDNDQPATLQMLEFSSRTFQQLRTDRSIAPHSIGPAMARDYRPGTIDQAATAVRVEQWLVEGKLAYRVVGITWGGPERTDKLKVRFAPFNPRFGMGKAPFERVQYCATRTSNREYGIWCQHWQPTKAGGYVIDPQLDAPGVSSRKMHTHDESGLPCYARIVFVPAV
jgi:DMSO/TMAO reductase YedYZ molybdopterin-dependent catalytic subunit